MIKKIPFGKKLKDFFTISEEDLRDWKKKNYETRQQMRLTTSKEDEEYDEEYDIEHSRD